MVIQKIKESHLKLGDTPKKLNDHQIGLNDHPIRLNGHPKDKSLTLETLNAPKTQLNDPLILINGSQPEILSI